jgi:hypothetical protein
MLRHAEGSPGERVATIRIKLKPSHFIPIYSRIEYRGLNFVLLNPFFGQRHGTECVLWSWYLLIPSRPPPSTVWKLNMYNFDYRPSPVVQSGAFPPWRRNAGLTLRLYCVRSLQNALWRLICVAILSYCGTVFWGKKYNHRMLWNRIRAVETEVFRNKTQCTYNVTLRRVRVTIIAVEKQ